VGAALQDNTDTVASEGPATIEFELNNINTQTQAA
jgi:hypothetical protein